MLDKKTEFIYRVILGAIVIGATIFLTFKYLMKGLPFIKVLALGLIVAVSYLVVDYLKKKSKKK